MRIRLRGGFQFYCGSCKLGLMCLKGEYKAFWLIYAVGWKKLPGGKMRKMWCIPHFRYITIGRLMKKGKDEKM